MWVLKSVKETPYTSLEKLITMGSRSALVQKVNWSEEMGRGTEMKNIAQQYINDSYSQYLLAHISALVDWWFHSDCPPHYSLVSL